MTPQEAYEVALEALARWSDVTVYACASDGCGHRFCKERRGTAAQMREAYAVLKQHYALFSPFKMVDMVRELTPQGASDPMPVTGVRIVLEIDDAWDADADDLIRANDMPSR
jgi:hypothetical protein